MYIGTYTHTHTQTYTHKFELGYNVMQGTEYFVSLQTNVLITEECNVMVNSEELIGTTQLVTLYARCRLTF
jgi:hypothetical protein